MIPVEAIEAAAKAYRREFPYDENEAYVVKLVLEAAHPVLLAELRKAHEALERVTDVLDNWQAEVPFQDAEESQRWYSLGKRHAAERIRYEIQGAAVAAAKGDEQ